MFNKIAAPIRFIYAYWTLKASVESDIGKVIKDILKEQYSDQASIRRINSDPEMNPNRIGKELIGIVDSELGLGDLSFAREFVQDLVEYFKKYDFVSGPSQARGYKQAYRYMLDLARARANKLISKPERIIIPESITSPEARMGFMAIHILKKQYPESVDEIDEELTPYNAGSNLLNVARNQLRSDPTSAYDVLQRQLAYWTIGRYDFRTTKKGGPGAEDWRQAFNNMKSNIKNTAIQTSKKGVRSEKTSDEEMYAHLKWKKQQIERGVKHRGGKVLTWTSRDEDYFNNITKRLKEQGVDLDSIKPSKLKQKAIYDKTIEQAFGTRPEGGGEPEGGHERVQTPQHIVIQEGEKGEGGKFVERESWLGKSVDDQASIQVLFSTLSNIIPRFRSILSPEESALFDVIYEDGIGDFRPGIDENMNQKRPLFERLEKAGLDKSISRIEGRKGGLGDLRTKLFNKLQKFIEENLTKEEFGYLEEEFFSDVDLDYKEKKEIEALHNRYKRLEEQESRKEERITKQESDLSISFSYDEKPDELIRVKSYLESENEIDQDSIDFYENDNLVWFKIKDYKVDETGNHVRKSRSELKQTKDAIINDLNKLFPKTTIGRGAPLEVVKGYQKIKKNEPGLSDEEAWKKARKDFEKSRETSTERKSLEDQYARLLYIQDRRKLTRLESREFNDIARNLEKIDVELNKIPPKKHDLGLVDKFAKLLWLEEHGKLTPEQRESMKIMLEDLKKEFDWRIIDSIESMKPESGEIIASSITRIAMRIIRRMN